MMLLILKEIDFELVLTEILKDRTNIPFGYL